MLEKVIQKKQAVPYKRYLKDIPHRKGNIATGRYPIKASRVILDLIKSAESNAKNKGMSSNLVISHISAHKGNAQSRYGRKIGKKAKKVSLIQRARNKVAIPKLKYMALPLPRLNKITAKIKLAIAIGIFRKIIIVNSNSILI